MSTFQQSPSRTSAQSKLISRAGKSSMQDVHHEANDNMTSDTRPIDEFASMSRATSPTSSLRLDSNTITSAGDATFTANTTNHYYGSPNGPSDPIMKPLIDRVIWAAMHDADERYDPPRCHPETRTAVLDRIDQWATGRSERPILWLNGPAGAGKSAIAQTLAERWKKRGSLGATFFMRRAAAGQNSREHLVPTLAHQLCMHDTQVHAHVKSAMISAPQILEKSLEVQLNRLVADAFVDQNTALSDEPVARVIIIDGLDECCIPYKSQSHEEQQRQILDSIASVSQRSLPLRFLIASRPESQIRQSFSNGPLAALAERISLTPARGDVELYLKCKLAEIRAIHPAVDHSWPPESDIDRLIENSSGHFVYPATVVRHLLSPRINPEAALAMILNQTIHPRDGQDWPLAQLDALYHHILHTAVRSIHTNAFSTLHLLTVRNDTFQSCSIEGISKYLGINGSQLYADLVDLHSVLHVPQDPKVNLTFHHTSFSEYLTDSGRSGLFCLRHPFSLQLQLKLLKYAQQFFITNGRNSFAVLIAVSGDFGRNYNANSLNNVVKCLASTILMANPNEIMGDLSLRRFWYITQRNTRMMPALSIAWSQASYSWITLRGTQNSMDLDTLKSFGTPVISFIWTILTQLRILLFFHISSLFLQHILSQVALLKKAAPGPALYIELIVQFLSSFTFSTLMNTHLLGYHPNYDLNLDVTPLASGPKPPSIP